MLRNDRGLIRGQDREQCVCYGLFPRIAAGVDKELPRFFGPDKDFSEALTMASSQWRRTVLVVGE